MSALLDMSLGRAFFAGLIIGAGLWHLLARWTIKNIVRRCALSAALRCADLVHEFAEAVEEPDEASRRQLFFDAVQRAYAGTRERS